MRIFLFALEIHIILSRKEVFHMSDNIIDSSNDSQGSNEPAKKSVLKEIWEWVYTILIAVIIALLIKGFLFDIVRVDGSSMFPTLKNNDRLIVTKLGYEPEQGDIIILDSNYKHREEYFAAAALSEGKEEYSSFEKFTKSFSMPKAFKSRYYVKRVIALPGQTVDLQDGRVYIDGQRLEESYYTGTTSPIDPTMHFPLTVEDDMVFVMGDNRPNSKDSRDSSLGQVPYEAILGKSQVRIWPLNTISVTR